MAREIIVNESANSSEGRLLRVNNWGPNGMWLLCAVMVLFGLLSVVNWLSKGETSSMVAGLGYLLFALFCGRAAVLGLYMEEDGIKVRTLFRDYHWSWDEIEGFELRGTVYTPSLRVGLRNGKRKGVVGLAARTSGEKAKAQKIINELNRRLELEHASQRSK